MYPESLGVHAIQGNFNFVSIEVTEGRYLPEANGMHASMIANTGIFYKGVKEQFFDKTATDIAVLEEVRKRHRQVKPANTVEGIIELASTMALYHDSVSDKMFGRDNQEDRLTKLLSYEVPSQLEWESNVEGGEPYPLTQFIETGVPFLRTREWLNDRLDRMRFADSDRFIAAIQITRRPAMVV